MSREFQATADSPFEVAKIVIKIASCKTHRELASVADEIKSMELSENDLRILRHLWKEQKGTIE